MQREKHKVALGINMSSFYCYSGMFALSLFLRLSLAPSLSHATCIIAFPLHWPQGKWSSHNVTVVILIDGVDTRAVPEHRASPHTDMTNFGEQIIIACIMINPLWGKWKYCEYLWTHGGRRAPQWDQTQGGLLCPLSSCADTRKDDKEEIHGSGCLTMHEREVND